MLNISEREFQHNTNDFEKMVLAKGKSSPYLWDI